MKRISVAMSVIVLGSSFSAFAQATSQTEYLKKARLQLEAENQNKILEMLENQRLQEEKARLQRIEGTSFSVQSAPAVQTPEQTATF